MSNNLISVPFSFHWQLDGCSLSKAIQLVTKLRLHALELGATEVSELTELIGDEAAEIQPAKYIIMFTAVIENGELQAFGLALVGEQTWRWEKTVSVLDLRRISRFMHLVATCGIVVEQRFAGMCLTYRLADDGVIKIEQCDDPQADR